MDFQYNNVTDGVMKGSSREVISVDFICEYRYKNLIFSEQLSVTLTKRKNPYGTFRVCRNPYWRLIMMVP